MVMQKRDCLLLYPHIHYLPLKRTCPFATPIQILDDSPGRKAPCRSPLGRQTGGLRLGLKVRGLLPTEKPPNLRKRRKGGSQPLCNLSVSALAGEVRVKQILNLLLDLRLPFIQHIKERVTERLPTPKLKLLHG